MTNSPRTRFLIRLLLVFAAWASALPAVLQCGATPCPGPSHAWASPAWDGSNTGEAEPCCDGRAASERCDLQECSARPRHVGGSRIRLRIVPPDLSPSTSPETAVLFPADFTPRGAAPPPVAPPSEPAFLKHRALRC